MNLWTRGEGAKKSEIFADVLNGSPQAESSFQGVFVDTGLSEFPSSPWSNECAAAEIERAHFLGI